MAAFRDDVPLVAGINENWDEDTTRSQIARPDWDFSPIRMKTKFLARTRQNNFTKHLQLRTMRSANRGLHASGERTDTPDDSQPCHAARMHTGTRSSHA